MGVVILTYAYLPNMEQWVETQFSKPMKKEFICDIFS